jgi:hypothetical protein
MILNTALIRKPIEAAQAMKAKVLALVGECMLEHKEEIVALLVHQQYEESIDSRGQPLRQYSPRYEFEKSKAGLYTGRTDLNYTGEFHSSINLTIDGDTYILDSPATTLNGVLKSTWLNRWNQEKGGADIMDFTEENKKIVWEIIYPTFKERANSELVLD